MLKNNPKILAFLIAAGISALGIVQYLALSGLIPVSALARVHWLFLPAYSVGGAFGVLFQWFLVAAVLVFISLEIAKRERAGDAGRPNAPSGPSLAQRPPETVQRTAPSFGRKSRL
jgi:hypothetical protein